MDLKPQKPSGPKFPSFITQKPVYDDDAVLGGSKLKPKRGEEPEEEDVSHHTAKKEDSILRSGKMYEARKDTFEDLDNGAIAAAVQRRYAMSETSSHWAHSAAPTVDTGDIVRRRGESDEDFVQRALQEESVDWLGGPPGVDEEFVTTVLSTEAGGRDRRDKASFILDSGERLNKAMASFMD